MTSAANGERGLGPGAVRPVQTRFRRSLTARGGQTGQYSPRCTQPTAESGKYFTPFVKKYYRNMFALCTKLCVSTVMRKCVPSSAEYRGPVKLAGRLPHLYHPPPPPPPVERRGGGLASTSYPCQLGARAAVTTCLLSTLSRLD